MKDSSLGLEEAGWATSARMALPGVRPRDSPTELDRERLGSGDGARAGRGEGGYRRRQMAWRYRRSTKQMEDEEKIV